MSWDQSMIDGPISVPLFGPEQDGSTPIVGYEPGYHLNICAGLLTPELEPHRVIPSSPVRTWAGDKGPTWSTIFLRFDDEAQARASSLGQHWTEEAQDA